jgi:hypothetical protein
VNQLIVLGPGRFLVVAVVVFVVWRAVCLNIGHRRGISLNVQREAVVLLLFGWALVVASLVFFPMNIILYDWHGTLSLIPFKSSVDLIRYSTAFTAVRNIGGNVLLFIPLGVLLPLLFGKLRRPWPLLWRAAVISAAIEVVQIPTQVRATDVDDVIWNVVGAMVGLLLLRLSWAGVRGRVTLGGVTATGQAPGAAAGKRPLSLWAREPLLAAAVPIAVTLLLTVGVLAPSVVSGTMDQDEVLQSATSGLPGAAVVARADLAGHTFLITAAHEGKAELLRYTEYKRVLPGRFTWTATGDVVRKAGSGYSWTLTTYNVARGEKPVVVIWGRNENGAATVVASVKGQSDRTFPVGKYFVAAFPYDPGADVVDDGTVNEVGMTFVDAAGHDLTSQFALW